ncbi:MAG: IS3 family transposase [Myxococcales bacterium]
MRVQKQQRYTDEFKAETIALMKRDDRTFAQLAADLGINKWTLREWYNRDQMAKKSKRKPGAPVAPAPSQETAEEKAARLERENERLRKKVETLEMDREIPKKSGSLLREGKRMRFAFIHAEKANFPVSALCRNLQVTRQGYYAFASRPPSPRADQDRALLERVGQVHAESRNAYGSPRVRKELRRRGIRVGKRRVERAMRSLGLCARPRRRFRVTTAANPRHPVEPNVLNREFRAERPNQRWVTDISYVWTDEGWCYLAVIIDLFSRTVVGWALDAMLSTQLPLAALDMALRRRRPDAAGLLHHSDRGCQYTSQEYRSELAQRGLSVSMSRKGNCWDNAVAESFFSTIKAELIHGRRWAGRLELRSAVFEYIEVFYNRRRLHSSLGYRTPAEFEKDYTAAQAA